MDALVDLTGGLAERYELKGADPNMYRHLLRAHRAGAFIACSRKVGYSFKYIYIFIKPVFKGHLYIQALHYSNLYNEVYL